MQTFDYQFENQVSIITNKSRSCKEKKFKSTIIGQNHDWNNLPSVILCNIYSYLSTNDRLHASSTCGSWRNIIYHLSLWPRKDLRVNLCSHKFVISSSENEVNYQAKTGFSIFALQDSISCNNRPKIKGRSGLYQHNQCKQNYNQHLKNFVYRCTRFLSGITIFFDPNSSENVMDLIQILKHFSANEVATYEVNNDRSKVYANCRNLKTFILIPVRPLVRTTFSQKFVQLYYGLTEAIRFLLSKCQFLEHISFGNLHELVCSTNDFLKQLYLSGHEQSIRHLNIGSVKGDFHRFIPHHVSFTGFEQFKLLQHLSVDFCVLNTDVINMFCNLNSLELLNINVHPINRYHSGIKKEAWSKIVTILPKLSVTVNLLHIEANSLPIILQSILDTEISLKVFRAYYLEFKDKNALSLMHNMLDTLASKHFKTLESVVLVDHVAQPNRCININSPNPFVMFGWRCRNLRDLTIIGFELSDIDIVAIARLRGSSLRNFHFPSSCIQLTNLTCSDKDDFKDNSDTQISYVQSDFNMKAKFKSLIAEPLGRLWSPLSSYQLPEIFDYNYIPQLTYHRTLIELNI